MKKDFIHQGRITITTTISPKFRQFLKEKGVSVSHALALGCRKMINDDDVGYDREKQMEENITKLSNRLNMAYVRIQELEDKEKIVRR